MSALEHEIMEKFHQLQPDARQRVRALIELEMTHSTFDYAAWSDGIETLRQQIQTTQAVDVVGILRDIRDGEDE